MNIIEGTIVGYIYDVYYDGNWIHGSDDGFYTDAFDTEEEAREDAESYIEQKIKDWKADGAWHEDDSKEYFDIEIIDVVKKEFDEPEEDEDEIW